MKTLDYAVLFPTLNRPHFVKRFLDSLDQQTRQPVEFVLVDQSDDDSTQKVFEKWEPKNPNLKKVYLHRKIKSLILSRNAALDAVSDVDLICFLDDDLVLKPEFCERLVTVFERDTQSQYAGGMGTVVPWHYRKNPLQGIFMMPREGEGKFQASGAPTYCHWKDQFTETEFLSGGITFWRTPIIKEYRYDERLSGYGHGDDVDVSYRVSRKHKLFYEPTAQCFHDEHSPGREAGYKYRKAWIQNYYYLAQKNGLSTKAYLWCAFGHLVRDLMSLDRHRVRGDIEGISRILSGNIDTVEGYREFIHQKERPQGHV